MVSKDVRPPRLKDLKLYFQVDGVADFYAVNGLISALKISKKRVVLKKTGREMGLKKVRKSLPGFFFTKQSRPPQGTVFVKFDTEGPMRLAKDGSVIATYDPFKYFLPRLNVKKKRSFIRRAMKLDDARPVLAVSCTIPEEACLVISAYKKIKKKQNPLFIIALRKKNQTLAGKIAAQHQLKVLNRRSEKALLSNVGAFDAVILNTMGEFFGLMPAADLAIVGHDRNIFEPAFCGVPALYFRQPLKMSRRDAQLAKSFKLFWRKNWTAKVLLDRYRGAAPIQIKSLPQQMARILSKPGPMIRGAKRAVHAMYHQIFTEAREMIVAKLLENFEEQKSQV